jgi:hypothetical protein
MIIELNVLYEAIPIWMGSMNSFSLDNGWYE